MDDEQLREFLIQLGDDCETAGTLEELQRKIRNTISQVHLDDRDFNADNEFPLFSDDGVKKQPTPNESGLDNMLDIDDDEIEYHHPFGIIHDSNDVARKRQERENSRESPECSALDLFKHPYAGRPTPPTNIVYDTEKPTTSSYRPVDDIVNVNDEPLELFEDASSNPFHCMEAPKAHQERQSLIKPTNSTSNVSCWPTVTDSKDSETDDEPGQAELNQSVSDIPKKFLTHPLWPDVARDIESADDGYETPNEPITHGPESPPDPIGQHNPSAKTSSLSKFRSYKSEPPHPSKTREVKEPRLVKTAVPPGDEPCPFEGCTMVFSQTDDLLYRNMHMGQSHPE